MYFSFCFFPRVCTGEDAIHLSAICPSTDQVPWCRPPPGQLIRNRSKTISLDLTYLGRPAQSKYLRPLYLISPGSRHWRAGKVGEEEVTLSECTLPAILATLWAGSISFGCTVGLPKKKKKHSLSACPTILNKHQIVKSAFLDLPNKETLDRLCGLLELVRTILILWEHWWGLTSPSDLGSFSKTTKWEIGRLFKSCRFDAFPNLLK